MNATSRTPAVLSARLACILALLALSTPLALVAQQTPADPSPQATPAQTPAPTQPPPAQPNPTPQSTPSAQSPASPASSAPAQTPTQPTRDANGVYTVRRSSRLVILDIVVIDRKGNPVTNLTRDSFHVTEANEPQTILNFEPAGAHTPDPALSINSTADLDRLAPRAPVNIILLDEFNTRFEDMAFARYSLKKYLDRQPEKLDMPTMLVAVDLQHFSVLRDYTQSKSEILSALDHHFVAYPWQLRSFSWTPERFSTAFGTLMRVAEASLGHPGHKNMIWIGRGFPTINFANNGGVDAATRVDNAVQVCVNMLRDARVTLYTIDPAGVMVDPGEYGEEALLFDPFGGNYQFNTLARATGGRTLYGRNDVDAEIGSSIRDGGSFYTLTYRPTNDSLDAQKFRRIKVTFDQPGLTAVTRQGYYVQRRPAQVNPASPSRRLTFDLTSAGSSNMVYDAVPVTLKPSPTDPYSFMVHVDPRAIVWTPATDTQPRYADLTMLVSTFDKKGKELKQEAKSIHAAAPTTVAPTGRLERAIEIMYKVDHTPKAVRARFVVRIGPTGRVGTADTLLGEALTSAAAPAPVTGPPSTPNP